MSYLPLEEENKESVPLLSTRDEHIFNLSKRKFDLLIIGGGIIGACLARLAAFNGLRTALLEKNDYASGTSSRSSKMAHGGLRYLAMLDFKQVFEGVRSREDLFLIAPHLAYRWPFRIPLTNDFVSKLKFGLALKLYDLLAGFTSKAHWVDKSKLNQPFYETRYSGAYEFFDGIMDDTRLVIENILSARQEGAVCLNYAKVVTIDNSRPGYTAVNWTDQLTGASYCSQAGAVVNCAGPWAPFIGRITRSQNLPTVKYSRGSHIIFNVPWKDPALLIPERGKSTYHFVWPHSAGTLAGTTEREVATLEDDPLPDKSEIEEILYRLQRDLPEASLSKENAHYCFAGIRTLPYKSGSGDTRKISRRHIWRVDGSVLSLVGGKFTSAAWTAYEGLKLIYSINNIETELTSLDGRRLPGAGLLEEGTQGFAQKCKEANVPESIVLETIKRLGSRVRFIPMLDPSLALICGKLLEGEIGLAIATEQATSLEDILRRRIGVECQPGHGVELVQQIIQVASRYKLNIASSEVQQYTARMAKIKDLLI